MGFVIHKNDSSFICGKLRGSEIVVKPRNEFCFVKLQSAKTTVVNIGLECFNLGEDACKVLIGILICGGVKMSKWLGRIAGMFRSGSMVGKDKAGNRYFTRNDEVDGICKCFAFLLQFWFLGSVEIIIMGSLVLCSNWVLIELHCTSNLLHGFKPKCMKSLGNK